MSLVIHAVKMNHAIQACKRRAVTTVSMSVELLLREDVAAVLTIRAVSYVGCCLESPRAWAQENMCRIRSGLGLRNY